MKQESVLEEVVYGPRTVRALVLGGQGHLAHRPVSPPYAGVCLAYFTSGFNTAAVDQEADGSTNNGIFQINSRKWCKNFRSNEPNLCHMYCSGRRGQGLGLAGATKESRLGKVVRRSSMPLTWGPRWEAVLRGIGMEGDCF